MFTASNIFLYILYVLVLAGLIIAISLPFQSNHKAGEKAPVGISSKPLTSAPNASNPTPRSNSNSSPATNPTGSSSNRTNQTTTGSNNKLANSGPGNIFSLFIFSSIGFGFLHWQVRKRKAIL